MILTRFLQDFDGKNLVGIDATDPNGLDDVVVQELHLPVGREIIFKMRSQDVLHSAYMPHFRAQMNCVPGMITEFAFTPIMTTEQMRQTPEMIAKVKKINKPYARKIQILTVGEQRAKVMKKTQVAAIFKRGKETIRKARKNV